jgi:hypothetical protein
VRGSSTTSLNLDGACVTWVGAGRREVWSRFQGDGEGGLDGVVRKYGREVARERVCLRCHVSRSRPCDCAQAKIDSLRAGGARIGGEVHFTGDALGCSTHTADRTTSTAGELARGSRGLKYGRDGEKGGEWDRRTDTRRRAPQTTCSCCPTHIALLLRAMHR